MSVNNAIKFLKSHQFPQEDNTAVTDLPTMLVSVGKKLGFKFTLEDLRLALWPETSQVFDSELEQTGMANSCKPGYCGSSGCSTCSSVRVALDVW